MPGAKRKPNGGQRRRAGKLAKVAGPAVQTEAALIGASESEDAFGAEASTTVDGEAMQSGPTSPSLTLPDCLDSAAAITVKEMLLAKRGEEIVVDASQVRRVGVQSLQVLVAAARTWQHEGHSYRLENPSPEFLETVTLVGLKREDLLLEGTQQ